MRIGIVTDIHDEADLLAEALAVLRAENIDVIISLGDTSDLHGKWEDVTGVAALLKEHGAIGVWGNHDHGLCRDVSEEARKRFPAETLEYMATMHPRLELGGCHFTHVEPWLNPESIEDLWCFDGQPEDDDRIAKSFAAIPHRAAFMGHCHRWLALTEAGRVEWDGTTPLHFEDGKRYLVVIGPLFRGDFAVMDTDRWILEPRKLAPPRGINHMKLILAIIQPSKLDAVKEALNKVEVFRLTIVDVLGFGRQKGHTEVYRGHELTVNMLRKVQLQIAVNEDFVEPTVNAIMAAARTGPEGRIGDGKIFILPLEDCIRIRTGERGPEAI